MATAASSHAREPSIPSFDLNPGFSFPEQSQECPLSTDFQFPPTYTSNEPYAFPPRRGSAPLLGSILPMVNNSTRPRSSQADTLQQLSANSKQMDTRETGPPSPEYAGYTTTTSSRARRSIGDGLSPTMLNASVRLSSSHTREASELLQIPMLEPKLDEKDTAPIQKRAPPPPGVNLRRGHAHRRSGAISSSDVWSLMKENAPPLPAPSTANAAKALAGDHKLADSARLSPGHNPKFNLSAPVSPTAAAEKPPMTPDSIVSDTPSDASETRRQTRVCFVENIEVVSRPSSSETKSSSTKALNVHGASGGATGSVALPLRIDTTSRVPSPTRRPHNRTRSNSQTLTQPTAALRAQSDRAQNDRPSTAGAILSSPEKAKSIGLEIPEVPSLKRPASASPFMNEDASPVKQPPPKKAHKKAQSDFSPLMCPGEFDSEDGPDLPCEGGEKKKKKGKKQIKDWAGNILGKGKRKRSKGSRKGKKSKRAPTPPVSKSAEHLTPGENEWVATSWNESYVIMPIDTSPVPDVQKTTLPSPVIDLDAALGPFKTPVETFTGFAAARRRMHSAARGNGSYLHRRSESMPEMQLFALEEDEDRPMEDVFEEDEEDESTSEEESSEDEDEEEGYIGGGDGLGIGIQAENEWPKKGDDEHVSQFTDVDNKRLSSSTITAATAHGPIADEHTMDRLSPRRKNAPADILTPGTYAVDSEGTFRYSFIGPALDSPSTFVTATSSPNTPVQNEFSSDDASSSFDPYRDYLGEPGPEMRMSVDDIPSLTSSSSTMTMNAAYAGMPSTPGANDVLPSPPSFVAKEEKKSKRWSRVWAFWRSK